MNTLFVGRNFLELASAGSTNELAWELLQEAPPEGTVVSALAQEAGRGQGQTVWHSEPGANLTFSLILYPRFLSPSTIFDLNRAICNGLAEAVRAVLPGKPVWVKWPNDLWVDNRKLCGVLIRNQFSTTAVQASVIGIGLNVAQTAFPSAIAQTATSLALEGSVIGREDFLAILLEWIEKYYLLLRAGKLAQIEQAYLQNLLHYQSPALYRVAGEVRYGVLVGVDRMGRAAIDFGGKLEYFNQKEVELCR